MQCIDILHQSLLGYFRFKQIHNKWNINSKRETCTEIQLIFYEQLLNVVSSIAEIRYHFNVSIYTGWSRDQIP
jgi:hypothetical protein